jgi:membrane protease YdiL (CAAX protease family)
MTHSFSDSFFKSACIFEASLVLVAFVLGWIADIDPFGDLQFSETAIFNGIMGTLPLIILFLSMQHLNYRCVDVIRKLLMETLASRLHTLPWSDLLILSAIAGLSEEVLFRGVVQPWMEQVWGLNTGLLVSSILFGLVHAITPFYAILAALVSIYLGWSLDYGETRNLLTPIVIHTLYDFFAFLMIIRSYKHFYSK